MSMQQKLKASLSVLLAAAMLTPALAVMPESEPSVYAADTVVVNTGKEYQTIDGFGGMNHPEWMGSDLTDAQRQKAFGNGEDELGLTILRIFVNPDSNQWNKAVPTAKFAAQHGAKVFASPWEPPSNLAESDSNGGKLHLPKSNYTAYAQHLNNFGTYMKNQGVDLYAISVQNEPDYASEWHQMVNGRNHGLPGKLCGQDHQHQSHVSGVLSVCAGDRILGGRRWQEVLYQDLEQPESICKL